MTSFSFNCDAWIHLRHRILPPGQNISGRRFCTSCQRIRQSRVKYLPSHQMSEERNAVVSQARSRLCPLSLYICLNFFTVISRELARKQILQL